MTKTTQTDMELLDFLEPALTNVRERVYNTGSPGLIILGDLRTIDNMIKAIGNIRADCRKLQTIEREVLEYDRALTLACDGKGTVGRGPDGRDYHELFAILSFIPPKEKV